MTALPPAWTQAAGAEPTRRGAGAEGAGPSRPGAEAAGAGPSRRGAGRHAASALATSALAVALTLALALAVALSATPWLRAYQVTGAAALLVVAAVSSVSITAAMAGWLGRSPIWSYGASLVGLVVMGVALAGGHPVELWHDLIRGPNRLLSEILPLGGSPAILAGPVAVTWLSGSTTAELLIRTRRSAAGLVIPVLAFALAYAATSSAPGTDQLGGPFLVGALAVAALVRHRSVERRRGVIDVSGDPPEPDPGRPGSDGAPSPRRRARTGYLPGWRAAGTGAAAALVAAVVLGVAIPSVSALSRHPVSLAHAAPHTTGVVVDPVDAVASLRDSQPHAPATPLFTVDTDRPSPGYFGIAVLDDYNGGTWSFDSTFHPSGGRIPAPPADSPGGGADLATVAVTQRYVMNRSYDLPFVPTLDRPAEVHGLAVDADAASAMVVPGQAGTTPGSYSAVSDTPGETLAGVASADQIGLLRGALDPVETADVTLPSGTATAIGDATRFLATLTGRRPAPTVAFLQAASAALQAKERRVDPADAPAGGKGTVAATGGTSLAGVINATAVVKAATPEQFATLFVMVARYLGVPARLVTGFRVRPGGGDGTGTGIIAAGAHLVTNRQAWTWAEIPVAGIGWVVADPTPAATTAATTAPPEAVQATPTTVATRQANAVPHSEITGGHAIAKPTHLALRGPHHRSVLAYFILGVAVILLLLGAVPAAAGIRRASRRRSRRSPDPTLLAVGAWLELLDGLWRAGMSTPGGATTAEVALSAGQHFGVAVTEPVRDIGAVADQALCSPSRPPDYPSAQRAWERVDGVRREVRATLDRRQRLHALISVGHSPRLPSRRP